jgi:hypothetical protein
MTAREIRKKETMINKFDVVSGVSGWMELRWTGWEWNSEMAIWMRVGFAS